MKSVLEDGPSSPSEPAVICSAPDPALGWRNALSLRSCYGGFQFFHVGFYRPRFCGPRGPCLNSRKYCLSGLDAIVHPRQFVVDSLFLLDRSVLESIRLPAIGLASQLSLYLIQSLPFALTLPFVLTN